nr:MAG TPA: hypothetical protein [Caudoviricetes sp.]
MTIQYNVKHLQSMFLSVLPVKNEDLGLIP